MPTVILPTSHVRDRIASVLRVVRTTAEPVYVTRYGRPKAVPVSIERINAMMDLLEDREDEHESELAPRIEEERAAYRRGEGGDLDEILAEPNSPSVRD